MGLPDMICDAAKDLLFKKAVNAGDGFRQWLYNDDYKFSVAANTAISEGMLQGKNAIEIAEQVYKDHA